MTTIIRTLLSEQYQDTAISPKMFSQIEVNIEAKYSCAPDDDEPVDPVIYLSTGNYDDSKTIGFSIEKEQLIYIAESILKHYM